MISLFGNFPGRRNNIFEKDQREEATRISSILLTEFGYSIRLLVDWIFDYYYFLKFLFRIILVRPLTFLIKICELRNQKSYNITFSSHVCQKSAQVAITTPRCSPLQKFHQSNHLELLSLENMIISNNRIPMSFKN